MIYTCLRLPSRGWYSFTDPGGMKGWVYLGAKYSQLRFEPATSWLQIWHSTTQPLRHWFLLPFRNIMARAVLSIYLQLELCVRNIIEVDECSGTCGEVGIATRRRHCMWIYFVSNIIQVSGAEADWCWDARFTRHSRWFGWQRKHLRDSQLIQFRFYPRYYLSFWFYCSPSTSALIVPRHVCPPSVTAPSPLAGSPCVEHSAGWSHLLAVAPGVQEMAKDGTVCTELLWQFLTCLTFLFVVPFTARTSSFFQFFFSVVARCPSTAVIDIVPS